MYISYSSTVVATHGERFQFFLKLSAFHPLRQPGISFPPTVKRPVPFPAAGQLLRICEEESLLLYCFCLGKKETGAWWPQPSRSEGCLLLLALNTP